MGLWRITSKVYLGDRQGATNIPKLRATEITHVVNVAGSKYDNFAQNGKMEYLNIRLLDRQDAQLPISKVLDFTADILGPTASDGVVLIHCRGGLSRSVSLVAVVLLAYYDIAIADGLQMIEEVRGRQFVNNGFRAQIEEFEHSLLSVEEDE